MAVPSQQGRTGEDRHAELEGKIVRDLLTRLLQRVRHLLEAHDRGVELSNNPYHAVPILTAVSADPFMNIVRCD